ncbi:MAG TPA: LysE family translocator [Anaerolineales bacterium]|nr:LysE family translocator [Anaerolineales bacterium]
MLFVFLRALLMGLSIAAPVGPIGVLTIRQTLAGGQKAGLATGMGAASADMVYGIIAVLGLSAISSLLLEYKMWIGWLGGAMLVYMGLRSLLSPPTQTTLANDTPNHLFGAFAGTFVLTLTNPATILSFIAIMGVLGVSQSSAPAVGLTVLGVFCGSAMWWLLLTSIVSWFRQYLTANFQRWVNRISGLFILSFGIWAIAGAVIPYI